MKKIVLSILCLFILTGTAYADVYGPKQTYQIYEIDSGVTDQGAATAEGNRSVKDFEDLSGTTPMTLVLDNQGQSGTSGYTDFVFATSETISSHIVLDIRNGARLAPASGVTLTLPSPANIDAGNTQQIFTGDGDFSFTVGGVVYPEMWQVNTTPGTTDMAPAAEKADAAVANGGIVEFQKDIYLFGSTVTKSIATNWRGVPARYVAGETYSGTEIRCGYDGNLVELDEASTEYGGYAGFYGIEFLNLDGLGTYPNAVAIYMKNCRQVSFEKLTIRNFLYGIDVRSCGELYGDQLFIAGCKYGITNNSTSTMADSMFSRCLLGSSLDAHADTAGGAGFRAYHAGNINFTDCRFQVQNEGYGSELIGCHDINFTSCIWDQNESHGAYFDGGWNININGANVFSNGTTASNKSGLYFNSRGATMTANASTDYITASGLSLGYGEKVRFTNSGGALPAGLSVDTTYICGAVSSGAVQLFADFQDLKDGTNIDITDAGTGTHTAHKVYENVRIIGGSAYDRDKGTANERQDVGIELAKASSNGYYSDITLVGVDLRNNATPLVGWTNVDDNFIVDNCQGLLVGSDTWDPGSIANGAEEAKEVTVSGAALGDFALASFSLDVSDLVLNAQVTAADTVTCILANNTGGAVDLSSGTIKAKVIKQD